MGRRAAEQPTTAELQVLLDRYLELYNDRRPHWSLPHRATAGTVYTTLPKATPNGDRRADTNDRVRHDKNDKADSVTLRIAGQLRHIGVGRTYASNPRQPACPTPLRDRLPRRDRQILRDMIIDPRKDYQPTRRGR